MKATPRIRSIKDAIGVLFLVITGLLYATGVTQAAVHDCHDDLVEPSVGASVETPTTPSGTSLI